ncbi:MAG: hypothetical protein EOP16_00840 [Pseudonocardia sp.]|nr:MAG: hypothetical protein EOP16_00840 [Pseudonocardia sp.]
MSTSNICSQLRGFDKCGEVVRSVVGLPGLRREFLVVNHSDVAAQVLNAPTNRNYLKDNVSYRAMRSGTGWSPVKTSPGYSNVVSFNPRPRRSAWTDMPRSWRRRPIASPRSGGRSHPDHVIDLDSEMTDSSVSPRATTLARTRLACFRS